MSINFLPLSKNDSNYSSVITLYKQAFSGAQRIPTWLLRYKLRNGKAGFNVLYESNTWIGLIYATEYKDIIFIQFLAITESCRSHGYGSKVMSAMKEMHPGKRLVLNIEELDTQAENYQQRVKRKAFYAKNGFRPSGFIIQEPAERLEMLILGGSINQAEIQGMYNKLFGSVLGFLLRPKVTEIG